MDVEFQVLQKSLYVEDNVFFVEIELQEFLKFI